jgi:hypothetical protein
MNMHDRKSSDSLDEATELLAHSADGIDGVRLLLDLAIIQRARTTGDIEIEQICIALEMALRAASEDIERCIARFDECYSA